MPLPLWTFPQGSDREQKEPLFKNSLPPSGAHLWARRVRRWKAVLVVPETYTSLPDPGGSLAAPGLTAVTTLPFPSGPGGCCRSLRLLARALAGGERPGSEIKKQLRRQINASASVPPDLPAQGDTGWLRTRDTAGRSARISKNPPSPQSVTPAPTHTLSQILTLTHTHRDTRKHSLSTQIHYLTHLLLHR